MNWVKTEEKYQKTIKNRKKHAVLMQNTCYNNVASNDAGILGTELRNAVIN